MGPLEEAIKAARAGERARARTLLLQVVQADEQNEQAWLWLSGVVDHPDDVRTALHNVLAINPQSERARQGLAWLAAHQPAAPPADAATPASTPPTAAPGAATAAPARPGSRLQALPLAAPPPEPVAPCPFCGASVSLRADRCPGCARSQLVVDPSKTPQTRPVTVAGWLLIVVATVAGVGAVFQGLNTLLFSGGAQAAWDQGDLGVVLAPVLGMLAGAALLAAPSVWAGLQLLQRRRAGLAAGLALGAALALAGLGILLGGAPLADALRLAPLAVRLFGGLGLLAGASAAALTLVGRADFLGTPARVAYTFEAKDHAAHYNAGVAYRQRGMWYLAVQEWEAAVKRQPRDLLYRHALGLAYAQLGQFDQARAALAAAIALAPDDLRLQESLVTVEQLARRYDHTGARRAPGPGTGG